MATNVGGIQNVVVPGKTSLLSAVSDKEQFCANLLELAEDKNLREQMSENGWNHVKDRFHYKRLCSDISALYSILLSNKKQE